MLILTLADELDTQLSRIIGLAVVVCFVLFHCWVVARGVYVTSQTRISDLLAKGIEPPRDWIEELTNPA